MPMVVKSAKRQTILQVYAFCEKEKAGNKLIFPLQHVRARVAAMTGDVSKSTVTRILRQERESSSVLNLDVPGPSKVTTPGKKRPNRDKKFMIDDFDTCAIRQKIMSFYAVRTYITYKGIIWLNKQRDLEKECTHVIKIEDDYIAKDKIIDEGSDRFLLCVGSGSDSEHSSNIEEDMIPLHLINHNYY